MFLQIEWAPINSSSSKSMQQTKCQQSENAALISVAINILQTERRSCNHTQLDADLHHSTGPRKTRRQATRNNLN